MWASVAPNEVYKLVKLKAGDEIVLRGVLGHVTNPRTAEHPAGVFRLGPKYCVIENVE